MPDVLPSFSVIVPTYDRPRKLRACLAALGRLDYPSERYEVIVADDGSPVSLQPVVDAAASGAVDVTLVEQQNAGPAAARNKGAACAEGRFLAFTDDDCAPAPGWLRALAARFAEAPGHLLGGRTVNALPDDLYATASQQLISYLYEYFDPDSDAPFFASNNIAIPTRRFHELGGFNTDFPLAAGEDRALCNRWHRRGWNMTHVPKAVVRHAHALSFTRFWRQHFNYGRGAFFFHKKSIGRHSDCFAPEPPSFYVDLLRYPFTQRAGLEKGLLREELPVAALLALSQVANAAGFFREKWEDKHKPEGLAKPEDKPKPEGPAKLEDKPKPEGPTEDDGKPGEPANVPTPPSHVYVQ